MACDVRGGVPDAPVGDMGRLRQVLIKKAWNVVEPLLVPQDRLEALIIQAGGTGVLKACPRRGKLMGRGLAPVPDPFPSKRGTAGRALCYASRDSPLSPRLHLLGHALRP